MSFVKQAVKKVFKTVKKVVHSKVFKIIAIAAAVFFTAGVAAGGFAAFSAAGPGIGGFFTAVGQTMATGVSAIAGGVGAQGFSATMAAHGGAAATAAGLAGAPSLLAPLASQAVGSVTSGTIANSALGNTVVPLASAATGTGGATAGGGILGTVKSLLSTKVLGDVSLGQTVNSFILAGATNVLANKNRRPYKNTFVAGGLARGGSSGAPTPYTFEFGGTTQDTAAPIEQQPTVAGELAQEPLAQPSAGAVQPVVGGIRGLLAARGSLLPQQPPEAGATIAQGPQAPAPEMPFVNGLVTNPAIDPNRPFQDTPARIKGGLVSA